MTEEILIKNTDDNITDIEIIEIEGYKIHTYEIEYLERIKNLYGFIYVTTNLINGKMYVGQRKINRHDWRTYLGSGTTLKKAIKKYGRENFDRKIIDIAFNANELNQLEYFYTIKFDSTNKDNWYNIVYGGGVNGLNIKNNKQRPVVRYDINGNILGEYKSVLDGANKTGDGRQSIHQCCHGKFRTVKKSNTVWRFKDDPFDKYSIVDSKPKSVKCYNKFQELIAIYKSIRDAERETGVDHTSITRCCNGEACCAGIYIWCYENENPIFNYDKMAEKPIYQYDLNGNFIKRFNSSKEAGLILNIKHVYINLCCNKKTKMSGGYKWYYSEDPNQPDKSRILYSTNKG